MKYTSSRFGEFEVTDDAILNIPDGLYGFEQETRFALLPFDSNIDSPLQWLHSLITPELAFVVTDPVLFLPDYEVTLTADDRRTIGLGEEDAFQVRIIVTVPEDYRRMTGNFLAPLVIHPGLNTGKQLVLTRQDYNTQHPLLPDAVRDN
ncbi:MAG: flagellar assembly protein FliW [Nitrospinae bacterium]|nr:flagellar assembly protein FliW [Nitrospinota bacterium]MCH8932165.1 flagellar assembly protein FliW [Nitrospinota bacterium]